MDKVFVPFEKVSQELGRLGVETTSALFAAINQELETIFNGFGTCYTTCDIHWAFFRVAAELLPVSLIPKPVFSGDEELLTYIPFAIRSTRPVSRRIIPMEAEERWKAWRASASEHSPASAHAPAADPPFGLREVVLASPQDAPLG